MRRSALARSSWRWRDDRAETLPRCGAALPARAHDGHDDALIGSRLGSYGAVRTQGEGGKTQKLPGVYGNCVQILPSLHEQLMTPPQKSDRSPHGIRAFGSAGF